MPNYGYECPLGHAFERYFSLEAYDRTPRCHCGARAQRTFTPVQIGTIRKIEYTSPIDGRPITTEAARRQDLARSNSVPYDPMMKQDQDRRVAASAAALEKSVSDTVERTVASYPSAKREKLYNELAAGTGIEIERKTVGAKQGTVNER